MKSNDSGCCPCGDMPRDQCYGNCSKLSTVADPVNHPAHYTAHPSGVECIDIVRHMTFNLGNVVKYLWRAGLKDNAPTLQDLRKAQWYLDDEIKKLEREHDAREH